MKDAEKGEKQWRNSGEIRVNEKGRRGVERDIGSERERTKTAKEKRKN